MEQNENTLSVLKIAPGQYRYLLMLPPCLVPSYRHRPMMNSYRALFHLQEDFE